MKKVRMRLVAATALATVMVLGSGSAYAQTGSDAAAGKSDQSQGLGDIVVTARKRAAAESLQATPVAASAISGDQLQSANAVNLLDVSKFSPGVSFQGSSTKSTSNFSIRGVGTSGTSPSDEPTVGTFQDGIYWGSQTGALGELFDLESVQVLRGPQGTLFGRNVTGGAIVLTSAKPTFTPMAKIGGQIGNSKTFGGSIILSGPIVGDKIAARLAAEIRTTDGYYHYMTGGPFGRDTVKLIRPSILFKPTDNFEFIVRGEYYQQSGESTAVRGYSPQQGLPSPVVTEPQQDGYLTPTDYYTVYPGDRGLVDVNVYLASAEMNWNIGPGVLTWINGFRQVDTRFRTDYDGFPTVAFNTQQKFTQHQVSSELRYAADIGKVVSFTAGLFFFHQAFNYYDTRTLDRSTVNLGQDALLRSNNDYAAFAEVDFKFTSRLTLTLGGRFTKDTKEAQIAPYGSCTPFTFAVCTYGPIKDYKDSHFTPKVGLSYKLSPSNLFYGSYTQGVRSGGYPLRGSALASPYDAEEVKAWEIGTKNDFFHHRLRVNLAGYIYDYTNIQRVVVATDPLVGIVQSVFNAAGATIKGFDVNVAFELTPNLRLDGSYGYVHARYSSFLGAANPGALRFVRVPASTAAVGATYTTDLSFGGKLEVRVSADYTNSYFFDDINQIREPDHWLTDGNIQYTLPSGKTSISIYARNIMNTEYSVWGSNLGIRGQNSFLGTPRTFGLKFNQEF